MSGQDELNIERWIEDPAHIKPGHRLDWILGELRKIRQEREALNARYEALTSEAWAIRNALSDHLAKAHEDAMP